MLIIEAVNLLFIIFIKFWDDALQVLVRLRL
jgi:hypothetical protein